MYSPIMMHCFILSDKGGSCMAGVAGIGAGVISVGVARGAGGTEARRSECIGRALLLCRR